MLLTPFRLLRKALGANASVYHFHDPELLFIALALRLLGRRVVFDFHEDVPKQLLSKPYLPLRSRQFVSRAFRLLERGLVRWFDGIIAATPSIQSKFESSCLRVETINNFPLLGELDDQIPWSAKRSEVAYVGGISKIRGVAEVIASMERTRDEARLNLCGKFGSKDFQSYCQKLAGWSRVNELGLVEREEVRAVLGRSIAGLVTFLPAPNHVDAQPNKMFEYMSAGIPVIASDFPLWREVLEGNQCGLCVDPEDPDKIAQAIEFLFDNPEAAKLMGERGRSAVLEKYNWPAEEIKLLNFYKSILGIV